MINCAHLQTIIYLRESRLKGAKLTGNSPCLSLRLCFPPAGGGGLGRRRSPAHRGRAPVPVPPAASALFIARGQRGGAGQRGAAGDCLAQRPRQRGGGRGGGAAAPGTGDPFPAAPPRRATPPLPPCQPRRGCPGTGGFLWAELGGSRAGSGDRCRRQPKAGWGRSACSRLSSPSSCARPCVRPSVPPGLSSRLPLSPEEKLHGPRLGEQAASSQSEMPFPVRSLPPPSVSAGLRPGVRGRRIPAGACA